jgi:hypothetical protein
VKCFVQGPQNGHNFIAMVAVFQILFEKKLVAQASLYVQQFILACGADFEAWCRITKWEDVTVDELCMVIALFMSMDIIQRPTIRSYF